MLKKRGVVVREEMFAGGHTQSVLKVYQGDVDAAAAFYSPRDSVTGEYLDARAKVAPSHPDVYDRVKILCLTEPIPNDPVVMRKGLPQAIERALLAALLDFQKTPEGKASLMQIASVEGFVPTVDADYNDVRKLVSTYGIDLEGELRKAKKKK
jgi:phosphonate transport system substrate-binding protein